MIELKNISVGLRCPVCNKNVIEFINRFQFASGLKICCPYCEAPLLSIKKGAPRDNLEVNCFACGETHKYSASSKSFFSGTPASFGCKTNAVDVLFVGKAEDVEHSLSLLSDEINRLTEKYYENFEKSYGSINAAALQILEKKAQENRIVCLCGSHEINLKMIENGINLICPKCGSSEFIPIASDEDIKVLSERRSILLK